MKNLLNTQWLARTLLLVGMATMTLASQAQWARVLTTSGDRMQSLQATTVRPAGTSTTADAIVLTDRKNQRIDGFGYALTYSACYNLLKMPEATRKALLRRTFSPTDGYGVSYVRISIGTSDFASGDYSLCDTKGPDSDYIQNFALQSDELNYVIPILKEVLAINPDLKIMAVPWTCPIWMKDPDTDGNAWNGGRLRAEYYESYARYFVKFVQAMQGHGIKIYAVSPQNEPLNGGNSASLWMGWEEMANLVKNNLAPNFHKAGLTTKIYVYDHNYNYDNNSGQVDYPFKIFDRIGKNFDGADLVVGSCWHNYGGTVNNITAKAAQYPDRELLFTESSIGEWNNGRNLMISLPRDMSEMVIDVLNNRFVGSLAWNFMLDMDKKPYVPGGCSTCFGAVDVDQNNGYRSFTYNSHYYIMAHASDAVKPDAYRVDTEGWWTDGLSYSAFMNPDGTKSIMFCNKNDNTVTAKVQSDGYTYTYNIPPKGVLTAVMHKSGEPEQEKEMVRFSITGSAAENGSECVLQQAPFNSSIYECFTQLNQGIFNVTGYDADGNAYVFGVTDGAVSTDGNAYTVSDKKLARVRLDWSTRTLTVTPVTAMCITGSITEKAWDPASAPELTYAGNGVWHGSVDLSHTPAANDPARFIFITNHSWDYQIKHLKDTDNGVGAQSDYGESRVEDITCQPGRYYITIDMNRHFYRIEDDIEIPTTATISGTATEYGEDIEMHHIQPAGEPTGVFECFTELLPGTYTIVAGNGTRAVGTSFGEVNGLLTQNGTVTVTEPTVAMVKADFNTRALTVVPVTSMRMAGSIVSSKWNLPADESTDLKYLGNGVWGAEVTMDTKPNDNDPERIVFVMNDKWDYAIKRVKGTNDGVALEANKYEVEDVPVTRGTYPVTLDLRNYTYSFANPLPTGIETPAADDKLSILGTEGGLIIRNGSESPVTAAVHAADGTLVWTGTVYGQQRLSLRPGVYIAAGRKLMIR